MEFNLNKSPIEIIKRVNLVVLILETFIMVLMENGTKINVKNLFSQKKY